jgi:hypothetical protein
MAGEAESPELVHRYRCHHAAEEAKVYFLNDGCSMENEIGGVMQLVHCYSFWLVVAFWI